MIATVEHWPLENGLGEYLIAPARSGIKTLQERKGKTVASNATNGGCDLMIRDHIRAAGILASAIKMVVIPFPQMKAALELGAADAVCAVDPFYAAIMASPRIEPTVLAKGIIHGFAANRLLRHRGLFRAVGLARQEQDGSNRLRAGDGGGR